MKQIVEVHFPDIKQDLLAAAHAELLRVAQRAGLKKKPSTSELLDWLKLLLAEDIPPEALRSSDQKQIIPPLHGALLKNEQDVSLFERLLFMNRNAERVRCAIGRLVQCPRRGEPEHADRLLLLAARREAAGVGEGIPDAARSAEGAGDRAVARRVLLPRAHDARQGREVLRQVRSGVRRVFPRRRRSLDEAAFDVPLDWLKKRLRARIHRRRKRAQIEALGGLDKLMERLKELFDEQKERHEGGSKWIGTGGTSPFGHGGYNPEGIRIGGESAGNRTAVKVWDERAYRDYDDQVEIGTRNIKVALRRLRRFAREGAAEELDLPDTIRSTAANAGWLDLKMVPERHNKVKVLMLLDVGGSMDDHIKRVEELFSAAKAEFKHLEFYYFHNCVYDYPVEEQSPASRRAHADLRRAAQVHARLQADLRRRRDHEPLRSAAAGRLGGIQQRRSRRGVAAPSRRSVPASRVAQSRAGAAVGIPAVDFARSARCSATACIRSRSPASKPRCGRCRSRPRRSTLNEHESICMSRSSSPDLAPAAHSAAGASPFADTSLSAVVAGFVAMMTGYTSSLVLMFQAGQAAHLTDAQISSWIWALSIGMARLHDRAVAALSRADRDRVVDARRGAARVVAAERRLCRGDRRVHRLRGAADRRRPHRLVRHADEEDSRRHRVGPAGGHPVRDRHRDFPRRAVPDRARPRDVLHLSARQTPRAALRDSDDAHRRHRGRGRASGCSISATFTSRSRIPSSRCRRFRSPRAISIGIPLFVVAMASQNVPGIAVLRADGYTTPSAPLISTTGIASLVLAPFGSHGVNLAAITAAICTGPEAHEDRDKRYMAAVWCGIFYLIAGVFGATIAALFAAFPKALVVSVAALALFGSIMSGLANAMQDVRQREAALVTFMVTASGLTLLSIGSAFWGLVAGVRHAGRAERPARLTSTMAELDSVAAIVTRRTHAGASNGCCSAMRERSPRAISARTARSQE